MTTTWNPSDKDSSQTLSNGNLTVTGANNSDIGLVRSVDSIGSNKVYWEVSITAWNKDETVGAGVSPTTESTADWLGQGTGDGSYADTGHVYTGGAVSATYGTSAATPTLLCFAEDGVNSTRWVRVGTTGLWNNSGTANPATNTGGRSKASLSGMKLAASCGETGESLTAHFASSSWSGTAPSGFGEINNTGTGASVSGATVVVTDSAIAGAATTGVALTGSTVVLTDSAIAGAPTQLGQTVVATTSAIGGAVTTGVGVNGSTVSLTTSTISGSVTTGLTITGPTVAETLSAIAGSTTIGISLSGPTVSETTSAIAGTPSTGLVVAGSTVSVTDSAIAGAVTTGVGIAGVLVSETESAIAGTASVSGSVSKSGAIIVDTLSAIPGAPTTGVSLTGSLVSAIISGLAGTATTDAFMFGARATAILSAIPGTIAFGDQNLPGVTVSENWILLPGIVLQDISVSGTTIEYDYSVIPATIHGSGTWQVLPGQDKPWKVSPSDDSPWASAPTPSAWS